MTYALIVALVATVLGHLVIADRRDARLTAERDADRKERETLLQRIQAPHIAVTDHSQQLIPDDPSGFPESDMEIAEREERERVLQFIERIENGAS